MTPSVQLALHEITLVLFTTLAPSGMLACAMCAAMLCSRHLAEEPRARLAHSMVVPLLVSMVGLVASATHLGTPANALYVLSGVGRSPLSNEVASCVVFLAFCGLHWLYSFSLRINRVLQRVWCVLIAASGIVAVAFVAFAYDEATIVTWAHWSVPAALCASAAAGAPLLTMLTLRIARVDVDRTCATVLYGAGAVGCVAAVCLLAMWWVLALRPVRNAVGPAVGLLPAFPEMLAVFALCATVAYIVAVAASVRACRVGARVPAVRLIAANLLFFAGLFVVRFAFYMAHMTVGISL